MVGCRGGPHLLVLCELALAWLSPWFLLLVRWPWPLVPTLVPSSWCSVRWLWLGSQIGSLLLVLYELALGLLVPALVPAPSFWYYVRWLWPLAAASAPSLWSSPAAVGFSLPWFYQKLLFGVDLIEYF